LDRKKKEIVDKSMDLFQSSLDRCLDNSVSSAPAAAGAAAAGGAAVVGSRRRVKRGREDDVDERGQSVAGSCGGDKAKKKKVNPKESNGKKFACPFYKHEPAKYRRTKTCCGPGWDDVHRAKEHVYRRHSLKNFCPRCFEHFDKPELLKKHQRADVPCKVQDQSFHAITEEQEKQLRTRAKPNSSEEDKWEEMYRTIFPDEKVPSPYYDTDADPSSPSSSSSSRPARSQFETLEEAREFLRVEIPRIVRPEINKYVDALFAEVQEKVNHKTFEIIQNLETKVLRTFHFQEEQASALPAATAAVLTGGAGSGGAATAQGGAAPGEPSPPPSPGYDDGSLSGVGGAGIGGPDLPGVGQFIDQCLEDELLSEVYQNMNFDLENLLAQSQGLVACDGYSQKDSAYYTSSLSGGQGTYEAMEGGGYMRQY